MLVPKIKTLLIPKSSKSKEGKREFNDISKTKNLT
jgi:hypothetical protein